MNARTLRPDRTAAIMQPYFYPYLPYFALLAAADTFVIYDCVQFPRRGRVHRTELAHGDRGPEWLTLPLEGQSRDVRISELRFAQGATAELQNRFHKSSFNHHFGNLPATVREHLQEPLEDVVGFLERGLRTVAKLLSLNTQILRSSSFAVDPRIRGADRVIAAQAVGANRYVNASGGKGLYDPSHFAGNGIELEFLRRYDGPSRFMLPALATTDLDELRREVRRIADDRYVAGVQAATSSPAEKGS